MHQFEDYLVKTRSYLAKSSAKDISGFEHFKIYIPTDALLKMILMPRNISF